MSHKLWICSILVLVLFLGKLQAEAPPGDADLDKHALAATVADEASLAKLAKYLARPCKSDRDKARVIYRWITDRIAYNDKIGFNYDSSDNRSEVVLKTRLAICEGYSALYLDLSKRMGLKAMQIRGHAKGMSYVEGRSLSDQEKHTWVAVLIKGKWQLVDPTWGAGYTENNKFVKCFREYYFLPAPEQLVFTHLPFEPKWQLVKAPLSTVKFVHRPTVDDRLFVLGASAEAVESAIAEPDFRGIAKTFTHPSTNTLIIKAPLKKHLSAGVDYEFKMDSGDYVEMALFNDKTFIPMEREGNVFHANVKPLEGMLYVTGRKSKENPNFSWVLGYVVEKPH